MKEKTDKSFGIIPARKNSGNWEVLLINQFSKIGNNTYWVFPKGHAEGSETPLESAKRELTEETGLKASKIISSPTFSLKYTFVYENEKIIKTVDFYIGLIDNQELTLDEIEVKEANWYSLDEAMNRLDYKDTKRMFKKVRLFLEELP